jgi:hypothetical protein
MNEEATERRPDSVGQTGTGTFDRCNRCNRRLKDPESMKLGLGPICRKRKAGETEFEQSREE